jgi:hypothetical protein
MKLSKWFRVSLREMLLLIVIVALGLGWWSDRSRITNQYIHDWNWLTDQNGRLRSQFKPLERRAWAMESLYEYQTGNRIEWDKDSFVVVDHKHPGVVSQPWRYLEDE